jgi:sugar phosphate isomerase/epimerase
MRIGVFLVLWKNLPFEAALDKARAVGLAAVEIGTGGYPGSAHCNIEELLASKTKRTAYLNAIEGRGLMVSALSVHNNPLHPNKKIAQASDTELRKTIQLARALGVSVVNGFSGVPGGSPRDTTINWITCPWPPDYARALAYQWNEVAIPYWKELDRFAKRNGVRVALEMHPGMLVYNVETMLRLRDAVGEWIGANFDPSHLFWNGVDPVLAINKLGDAIFHMHGKDVYLDAANISINGCNDNKAYTRIKERAWTFRSIGYGHDLKAWKDMVSALRVNGYDNVISIEHEDGLMSTDEGLRKAIDVLRQAIMTEPTGEMYWA